MQRSAKDLKIRNLSSSRINASYYLQQLLYYQIFFSIAWIIFWAAWIFYKVRSNDSSCRLSLRDSLLCSTITALGCWQ